MKNQDILEQEQDWLTNKYTDILNNSYSKKAKRDVYVDVFDKKNEYIQLEQKYLDVKMTPCKADDVCSNKSIDIPNFKVASAVVTKPTPCKKQIIIQH